jgi:hypothetical protein
MNQFHTLDGRFSKISKNNLVYSTLKSRASGVLWTYLAAVLSSVVSAVVVTAPAQAFVDVELSAGKRSGTYDSKAITSSTVQMAAHLDPIPLVPVAFGLRMISDSYSTTMADQGIKSLTSTAIVPEIAAWLPLGDLKPFARVGYTVVSAYKGTVEILGTNISVPMTGSGPRIAVGIQWSLLPLISLTAALEHSGETLTLKAITSGAITIPATTIKLNSNAILLGAKVGI